MRSSDPEVGASIPSVDSSHDGLSAGSGDRESLLKKRSSRSHAA